MYDFPVGANLFPDLSVASAVVAADLTLIGGIWLAAAVIALLVIIPLAARPVAPTAVASDTDLPKAAWEIWWNTASSPRS